MNATNVENITGGKNATRGMRDHDHDLVHDLSRRLDALWRYDQYAVNAKGKKDLQDLWGQLKIQEEKSIKLIKQAIEKEVSTHCF